MQAPHVSTLRDAQLSQVRDEDDGVNAVFHVNDFEKAARFVLLDVRPKRVRFVRQHCLRPGVHYVTFSPRGMAPSLGDDANADLMPT